MGIRILDYIGRPLANANTKAKPSTAQKLQNFCLTKSKFPEEKTTAKPSCLHILIAERPIDRACQLADLLLLSQDVEIDLRIERNIRRWRCCHLQVSKNAACKFKLTNPA